MLQIFPVEFVCNTVLTRPLFLDHVLKKKKEFLAWETSNLKNNTQDLKGKRAFLLILFVCLFIESPAPTVALLSKNFHFHLRVSIVNIMEKE